ncbi:MAG: hypothetical protein HY751_10125 [Nitrospinae bacterium]|nr:hypothetical protein [Nitrospinota bacterium]
MVITALLLSVPALSSAGAETKLEQHGFTSAKTCGECHKEIYDGFSRSLHAISSTNPIFSLAFDRAYRETKGAAKDMCGKCHAPTTLITKDHEGRLPITAEGVTCDFCHSVESVDISAAQPFRLDVAGKKRGSMQNASSPAHAASYAEWFKKSEMCAPCHEVTSAYGVKTATTFSEWKASGYSKKGVQCQDCHMPQVSGRVADVTGKSSGKIHDHGMSHNVELMKGAVRIDVIRAEKTMGDRFVVELGVTNVRAGHSIPTGSQPRELTLEVTIKGSDGRSETQRKGFGKKIAGPDGKILGPGWKACVEGKKIAENTSIKPMETRATRFMFNTVPKDPEISATAFLSYSPEVPSVENIRIPLGSTAAK